LNIPAKIAAAFFIASIPTAATAQVVLDLRVQRPGTTVTQSVPPGDTSVRIINMVPLARTYDLALKFERIPMLPLPSVDLPWLQKPAGTRPEVEVADPCKELKADVQSLHDVDNEDTVAGLVKKVRDGIAAGTCTDATVLARGNELIARTTLQTPTLTVRNGERWTITVTRTDDADRVWNVVLTTEPRGAWVTTYGFTFGANRDELYFSKAKDGGKFTITPQTDNGGATFIPSIFFSWLPTSAASRDLIVAPTAGLGVTKDRPAVIGGVSFTFNQNIGAVFGVAVYGQQRLNGRYTPNQEIAENLSDEQLHTTVMRPGLVLAATYRFGNSPFSSGQSGCGAATAGPAKPGSGNATPAAAPAVGRSTTATAPPGSAEARVGDGFRLSFSEKGELTTDRSGLAQIDQAVRNATDVFVLSHGWWNNKETAECRYGEMIGALGAGAPVGSKPLFIGIYWPSAVFPMEKGDCESGARPTTEAMAGGTFETQLRHWAPEAFPAAAAQPGFGTQLEELNRLTALDTVGTPVSDADLQRIASILSEWTKAGAGDRPAVAEGPEVAVFDGTPAAIVERWKQRTTPGGAESFNLRGALDFANAFTFWAMKQRAGVVGGAGVYELVKRIRDAGGDQVRIHLIGHSFGGKLVSAAATGVNNAPPNVVDSVFLLQGAFSHFAFSTAAQITAAGIETTSPGVYARLLARTGQPALRGALVAMFSSEDSKNKILYPVGVSISRDFLERNAPSKYGSVGADGLQALAAEAVALKSQRVPANAASSPRLVNVDAGGVVHDHSDIVHPQVFDMIWDVVKAQVRR
jgi:pimeloyl-ACP methyl ester carboxylesterase